MNRLNPTTTRLLRVLAELDEECLGGCYGIIRHDNEQGAEPAPMDEALFAWRDAGCPDLPSEPLPDVEVDGGRPPDHVVPCRGSGVAAGVLATYMRDPTVSNIHAINECVEVWFKCGASITPEDAAAAYRGTDEDSEPWDRCEGCKEPATCEDAMGIPLCDKCFDALPEVSGE